MGARGQDRVPGHDRDVLSCIERAQGLRSRRLLLERRQLLVDVGDLFPDLVLAQARNALGPLGNSALGDPQKVRNGLLGPEESYQKRLFHPQSLAC